MQELLTVYRIYKRSTAPKYKDPICCNSCMVLSMFWPILYFLCETSTWHLDSYTPLPPTPVVHVLWRDSVGVEGSRFKSVCADIFHQILLWLLRHTDEPQKGRNSCLWLQSRSVFGSVGVVLMSSKLTFTWYDQHSEHCSILLATFNV